MKIPNDCDTRMTTWAEISLMLTTIGIPGVYVRPDLAFDHIIAEVMADDPDEMTERLINPAHLVDYGFNGQVFKPINCIVTYTRRKVAPGAASYRVEWSDTLADDWSATNVVTDPPVSLSTTGESVHSTLPAGTGGQRFVRITVVQP